MNEPTFFSRLPLGTTFHFAGVIPTLGNLYRKMDETCADQVGYPQARISMHASDQVVEVGP